MWVYCQQISNYCRPDLTYWHWQRLTPSVTDQLLYEDAFCRDVFFFVTAVVWSWDFYMVDVRMFYWWIKQCLFYQKNILKQFFEWLSLRPTCQFASITSWAWRFLNIDISQGSVATFLRCNGTFKYAFVANVQLSLAAKEFWKSVNIWRSYGQEFSVLLFWLTVYIYYYAIWQHIQTYKLQI